MFPWLESVLGLYGAFYLFGGVMIICTPVVYCILPETKDISLEMVKYYFTSNKTVFYIDCESGYDNSGYVCET